MQNAVQCPIPENEAQRLKAVLSYQVLDTPPEMDFDALTRVASHTFGTPAAVVGLMDTDRLWFKSRLGLEVPQLDRQIAFCAHAVMRPGELLVVNDLLQDSRFMDNPLVANAPHIRFYAGAPLVDPNGFALGTIAVVDTRPRSLDRDQQSVLKDLSALVMTALENRRRSLILQKLAMTDFLTGLSNRAEFDMALQTEIAHAKRTGKTFTLLCADLDGFKEVNDRFGHAAGDEVLCEVARRLQEQARVEDMLARLGGDEFAVILRDGTLESVDALTKRIMLEMSRPITLSSGDKVVIGISVGMASRSDAVNSAAALLAEADRALYQDKQKNRKRQ